MGKELSREAWEHYDKLSEEEKESEELEYLMRVIRVLGYRLGRLEKMVGND